MQGIADQEWMAVILRVRASSVLCVRSAVVGDFQSEESATIILTLQVLVHRIHTEENIFNMRFPAQYRSRRATSPH